jgi:hypothetical protein
VPSEIDRKYLELAKGFTTAMNGEVDYTHQWDTHPVELDGKNSSFKHPVVTSASLCPPQSPKLKNMFFLSFSSLN